MVEVAAAVVGASLTMAGISFQGMTKRNSEAREAVIRLSVAVEQIGAKLEELHDDMRDHNKEIYGRLNNHAERIRALENR